MCFELLLLSSSSHHHRYYISRNENHWLNCIIYFYFQTEACSCFTSNNMIRVLYVGRYTLITERMVNARPSRVTIIILYNTV